MSHDSTRLVVHAAALVLLVASVSAIAQTRPAATFEYDPNGNLTRRIDALGRATSHAYDRQNRLRQTTQPAPAVGRPATVTSLGMNPAGQLVAVTDPRGLVTRYTLNGLGDTTRLDSPDTGATLLTQDAAGNALTRQDARGRTTTASYDSLDRLTRLTYADGAASVFTYDQGATGVGRLTQVTDPGGQVTTWTYNVDGQVTARTQTVTAGKATVSLTVRYAYEQTTGRLASITYPSGRVASIEYDPISRLPARVLYGGTVLASGIEWHRTDPLAGGSLPLPSRLTLGHGGTWSSSLDVEGRITRYTLAGQAVDLSWDAANRLTGLSYAGNASLSAVVGYDALDRLIAYTSSARTQRFSYDATGNRLSKTDAAGSQSPSTWTSVVEATSNRMLGYSAPVSEVWTWDAAGHLLARSNVTFTHDARGRLTAVTLGTGRRAETVSYTINALGQRTSKSGPASRVPAGTVVYVYDEAGRLLGEYDSQGRALTEVVWLADRPLGVWQGSYRNNAAAPATSVQLYAEADHLGTPRRLADGQNRTRWSWNPAPFGDTLPEENPAGLGAVTFNLRLPGQTYDAETNLHQNWHRDYDPATGRYIQSDPIGLEGGINTFAYVSANPLLFSDPSGLVYYCTAPLHAWPAGDLNGLGPFHHAFLCDRSTRLCGGQDRLGNGLLSPGKPSEGDRFNPSRCEKLPDSDCINDCVTRKIQDQRRPPYTILYNPIGTILAIFGVPVTQNCQDWAKSTYLQCGLDCRNRR